MSIEYRGDNKYRFRVRKDGIYYYQNYYCKKKVSEKELIEKKYPKEVIDAHKKYEVQVMSGDIGTNENMKFHELAQLVLDEHVRPNLKPNTINAYKTFYNIHILEVFGDIQISKIKKINIQKFINEKSKCLKPSSIERLFSSLNATFSKAVDWELIKDNPCKKIVLPKVENKNYSELLSSDQISDLFTTIEQELEMYKVIFLIALGAGLRQGEILGLTIDDIDFKNNLIKVDKQYVTYNKDGKVVHEISSTKTENSVRNVYMTDSISKSLEKYISGIKVINIKNQYLFINKKTNKIYDHNAIYRRFKKMLKLNNLKEITFHDLRHLHATMLINSGVNIVVVAKRLGDTVETVSDTYLHSIEKVEKESVTQLENFIGTIRAAK